MNPLDWTGPAWAAIAAVFGCLCLLAHRWTYTTTTWERDRRRNQQWLLITGLLAATLLAAARAWAVS